MSQQDRITRIRKNAAGGVEAVTYVEEKRILISGDTTGRAVRALCEASPPMRVEAMVYVRALYGLDLRDAKEVVDTLCPPKAHPSNW